MRPSRKPAPRRGIGAVLRAALVLACVALPAVAAPRAVTVKGSEPKGFGRIALGFDAPVKVTARASGTVLVVGFGEQAAIRAERLAEEMPEIVGIVRRDPDGSGLRIALTRPMRVNVLEAGERVFVDLLPENWAGLPPGLPQEVVDDLARRAREAEAKAKRAEIQPPPPEPMALSVAELPTLLRLVFPVPTGVDVAYEVKDGTVRLAFAKPYRLDESAARGRLSGHVRSFVAQTVPGGLKVAVALAPDVEPRGFREDDGFVLDLAPKPGKARRPPEGAKPGQPPKAQEAKVPEAKGQEIKAVETKVPEEKSAEARPAEAKVAEAKVAEVRTAETRPPEPAAGEPAKAAAGPALGTPVRAVLAAAPDGARLNFPFPTRTAAALYERGGIATLVFETAQAVELPPALAAGGILVPQGAPERMGAFVVARFAVGGQRLVQLAPDGATGWTLATDGGLAAREPLAAARSVDANGRTTVLVPLKRPGSALWLPEERVTVVTAHGPQPAGVPKPQRFVEFELLPTAQGVAVLAAADDLLVRPGLDGVTIGRNGGLAVSLQPAGNGEADANAVPPDLAIARDRWLEDGRGDVGERLRERLRAAADAPRSARADARLDYARALMAANLDAEAAIVLGFAVADDPALEKRRGVVLLRGIAAARARRDAEALKWLAGEVVGQDPEAKLWRALLDARAQRWPVALAGFRRAAPLIEAYPDDLQAELRAAAARAAIEEGDLGYAETELSAAEARAVEPGLRETVALLRARLAEAAGRPEAALDGYRRLAAANDRPAPAEATLRGIELALAQGAIAPDEALRQLETLNVWWRGDAVEARTISRLARLYAEAGRWRDAFAMARRANRLFPDHPETRTLHEDTVKLFDALFLAGKGADLSRVETLALYFDFREFTPVGRRGDEIVRRLSDRLVELDLLEQAGDLLEHQVTRRLTGAARATVAARLATIRLMDGRASAALATLHATRLPELPAATKRARTLLEARALSDLTRTDLALDVLDGERGDDAARLRADILWGARRWREAGEAHEGLVGERWRERAPLSDTDRADVIRAAIAFALAEEPIGLDRLRAKFAARMAESADARTFAFLSQPNVAATRGFRDLARSAANTDTLSAFLAEYRKRYPEASAAARPASETPPPG